MKPVYTVKNTRTRKVVAFSNARLAYDTYREIWRQNRKPETEAIAYSTFQMKIKKNPFQFLDYIVERPLSYAPIDFQVGQHIAYLNATEEFADSSSSDSSGNL